MVKFEDMSNEVILCVWDQLTSGDVMHCFSHLNTRINSLLLEFCGLYKYLNLCYCSLSACRFLCRQVVTMNQWQNGLIDLKLGNRFRCAQIDMFANEVMKSIVTSHFTRQGRSCNNVPNDMFYTLMKYSKGVRPIFPQLTSFVIFQSIPISEAFRDVLLFSVAGGSSMCTFVWNACANQTNHSRAFFDWLFRCSVNLIRYKLQVPLHEDGFELQYEHTIMNAYVPHHSLIYLTINILNLATLYVLLHYLPQLEHLGNKLTFILRTFSKHEYFVNELYS